MVRSRASGLRGLVWARWSPRADLAVVALSWLLVVGALYTATVGVTADNGIGYFLLYAVLGAGLFGIGIPLYWTVVRRGRPLSDLGITSRYLMPSLVLQLIFAAVQYQATLARTELPPTTQLVPLVALALTIGFFEAVFWRGWVLLRLEESFGLIPAVLVGSLLYAAYHIGYAMPLSEITFLFVIGLMFAVVFRLTKSIFILWPLLQPMGQLVTLLRDRLQLPLIASLGFVEVLAAMWVLVRLIGRYHRRRASGT
ncbi:MAG: CPBP family intramembrane metalloprotease [Anaerolineae bacterium]|nr:CPBP family intramembrane metalloprotease [Anaerolineae bacterium]